MRRKWPIGGVALLAFVGVIFGAWYHLFRQVPRHYASIEEHFKYGSIGVEAASGIPYWVWAVLPRVFADKIGPDGYRSFGFIFEDFEYGIEFSDLEQVLDALGQIE